MKTLDYTGLNYNSKMVDLLNQLLADYQIFYTNLRGFHWHIEGKHFFHLHSKFEELYDNINEKADEIAERLLMIGAVPTNKFSNYLKISKIKEVEGISSGKEAIGMILDSYKYLISLEREILEEASNNSDEATVAMMSDYIREQEKLVWMLVSYMS